MSTFLHSLPWTFALALAQAGDAGAALSLAPLEGSSFVTTASGFSQEASEEAVAPSLSPAADSEAEAAGESARG
jgi:hypothetical protein